MPLKPADQALLGAADPAQVKIGCWAVARQMARDRRWVSRENRYAPNPAAGLDEGLTAAGTTNVPNPRQMRQYVAASTVLHALDGWTYLSRALACHVRGDIGGAVHLAYYAELRAASALLGSRGVAVLNNKHVVLQKRGRSTLLAGRTAPDASGRDRGLGTHVFAWEALSTWASQPDSGPYVGGLISPGGIPVSRWFSELFLSGALPLVAEGWLTSWGIDLQRFAGDRDLRNEFSYGPEGLRPDHPSSAAETKTVLEDIWRVLEPAPELPFWVLDRHLLRSAIEVGFRRVVGRSVRQAAREFERRVSTAVAALSPGFMSRGEWVDFLLRRLEPEDAPLVTAAGVPPGSGIAPHVPVLARSVMLLRLASGAARAMLEESRMSPVAWEPWWTQRAIEQGLWDAATAPSSAVDLWADVRDALEDIAAWSATAPAPSSREFLSENAGPLVVLFQAERVGLWSLVA